MNVRERLRIKCALFVLAFSVAILSSSLLQVVLAGEQALLVAPAQVDYKKKTEVLISGSGFDPGQKLALQVSLGGLMTDISLLVKPNPVANEFGAFSSVWPLDREFRRNLLKPTAYTVQVVDEGGNVLATAPLSFKKVEK